MIGNKVKKNIIPILAIVIPMAAIVYFIGIPFLKVFIPIYKENLRLHKETQLSPTQSKKSSDTQDNFMVYENALYKYRVKYPESWKKVEMLSKKWVNFSGPDDMTINILVSVDSGQKPFDFAKFKEGCLKLKEEGYEIIECAQTRLGNNVAHKSITVEKETGREQMIITTSKNGTYYTLTYTNQRDSFNRYLDIVQNFIDSFEINQ